MTVYLDSSVVLRRLLGQTGAINDWDANAVTSEMTRVECMRALDRLRLAGNLDDSQVAEKMHDLFDILERTRVISVDARILERAAAAFPTVLGALDAVHLASALLYAEEAEEKPVVLTHDVQLTTAARAVGLETRGAP